MAILKRLDYIIKKDSAGEIATQLNSVVANLNQKQENAGNKIGESDYKVEFYATLFDPRNNKEYLAFSDKTKATFSLSQSTLLLTSDGGSVNADELKKLLIDDSASGANKTYSSAKIDELIKSIQASGGGVGIKDDVVETISVWSSKKSNDTFALKTELPKMADYVSKEELNADAVSVEFLANL